MSRPIHPQATAGYTLPIIAVLLLTFAGAMGLMYINGHKNDPDGEDKEMARYLTRVQYAVIDYTQSRLKAPCPAGITTPDAVNDSPGACDNGVLRKAPNGVVMGLLPPNLSLAAESRRAPGHAMRVFYAVAVKATDGASSRPGALNTREFQTGTVVMQASAADASVVAKGDVAIIVDDGNTCGFYAYDAIPASVQPPTHGDCKDIERQFSLGINPAGTPAAFRGIFSKADKLNVRIFSLPRSVTNYAAPAPSTMMASSSSSSSGSLSSASSSSSSSSFGTSSSGSSGSMLPPVGTISPPPPAANAQAPASSASSSGGEAPASTAATPIPATIPSADSLNSPSIPAPSSVPCASSASGNPGEPCPEKVCITAPGCPDPWNGANHYPPQSQVSVTSVQSGDCASGVINVLVCETGEPGQVCQSCHAGTATGPMIAMSACKSSFRYCAQDSLERYCPPTSYGRLAYDTVQDSFSNAPGQFGPHNWMACDSGLTLHCYNGPDTHNAVELPIGECAHDNAKPL